MDKKQILLIIIIASCVASLLGLGFSLISIPFIASIFDAAPLTIALSIGIPICVIAIICSYLFTKNRNFRLGILLPLICACTLSCIIAEKRFPREYQRGITIDYSHCMYNKWGFCIINLPSHDYHFGRDCNGGQLIIASLKSRDFSIEGYPELHEFKYYNLNGDFLGGNKFYGFFSEAIKQAKEIDGITYEKHIW